MISSQLKKKKRFVKEGKIKPILLIKKFRYAILGLFYKYELQFIIISIIVIIIVGIILGLKLFR